MNSENPYDPPQSEVRDPDQARLLPQRPRQILQALLLLWISSTLGTVSGYSQSQREPGASLAGFAIVVGMILLLTIVMSTGIWRGRNWARIMYLVLVSISFASLVSSWGLVERPGVEVALESVSYVADFGSFFLMFTRPGSLWFQSARDGFES
jgi:hypothetical protein